MGCTERMGGTELARLGCTEVALLGCTLAVLRGCTLAARLGCTLAGRRDKVRLHRLKLKQRGTLKHNLIWLCQAQY